MKPTLKEVLQALVDGKEVRNTDILAGGWWSLDACQMQSKGLFIDPSDHYAIRDKVRPHHHAEIIKVWVENPRAYQVECSSADGSLMVTHRPAWYDNFYYRLIDINTEAVVMESEGAK